MYEAFYELRGKPFSILPDPDMIYWGRMHSMAFTMLEFGVMNNAGFTVITGEIGSGKTTLVRHLLKKLPTNISVGLISNSSHPGPSARLRGSIEINECHQLFRQEGGPFLHCHRPAPPCTSGSIT